jgi:flavin-binding protein dodecin
MSVAKIIEIVGSSDKSWEDAAKVAIKQATKTVRGLRGLQVVSQTAVVENNQIKEYRTTVKLSFAVETPN